MKSLKIIGLAIAATLIMASWALAAPSGVPGEFTLDLPSGWTETPVAKPEDGDRFEAQDTEATLKGKHRGLVVNKVPGGPRAGEVGVSVFTDSVITELVKNPAVQGRPVKELAVINGQEWGCASYNMEINGLNVKNVQFLTVKGNEFYTVIFVAVDEDFTKTDPLFKEIMSTFEFSK